jgi:ankyrin repeat protein
LTYALLRGDIDRNLVRLLLEAGCPVDGRDLHHPVYQRDLDVVKLLLTAKPDVNRPFDWPTWVLSNERGDTPLFVAVAKNSAEILGPEMGQVIKPAERLAIIDLLIEAGADVNAQRGTIRTGWTPLMLAAAQDEDEIARRFLDAGADPNKTVECNRITLIDGRQKRVKGPLSATGMAQERPDNKKIRRLLLGHE